MARAKKEAALTPEERLQAALVPDWEWPYKLPKNWCWTRIGMVSNFERGITFPAAAKEAAPTEDNIPCLRTANVQENLEIDDMIYVNRDFMKGNIAKLVRENDIIMSSANSRELVGKSSLVTHIPFPSYFQNANTGTAVVWRDWKYKVGDHILFNDTDRFSLLYNNLKGRIVQIELFDSRIRFTVDVEIPLTEQDCQNDGIEFIDIIDDVTRIRFDVLDFEEEMADEDRKKAIVPFQLAYAVSIHKAQGLEYRSVKVVIPSSNAEKITHGIFYTAITRAKEKLKIYWSSETMQEVVAGFSVDTSKQKSLAIIKEKLKQDKNT